MIDRETLARRLSGIGDDFRRLLNTPFTGDRERWTPNDPRCIEELAAFQNAARTVFFAVESGFLINPSISGFVGGLIASGFHPTHQPLANHQWAAVFNKIVVNFLYPHAKQQQNAILFPQDHASQEEFLKQELRDYASCCDMLAGLVRDGNVDLDSLKNPDDHEEPLWEQLAADLKVSLAAFSEAVDEFVRYGTPLGAEWDHFELIVVNLWKLRCWWGGSWPAEMQRHVDELRRFASLQSEESVGEYQDAADAAAAILKWFQTNGYIPASLSQVQNTVEMWDAEPLIPDVVADQSQSPIGQKHQPAGEDVARPAGEFRTQAVTISFSQYLSPADWRKRYGKAGHPMSRPSWTIYARNLRSQDPARLEYHPSSGAKKVRIDLEELRSMGVNPP